VTLSCSRGSPTAPKKIASNGAAVERVVRHHPPCAK
jgi:hypothetical protein